MVVFSYSVLEAANFELRKTIEGFEKEHKQAKGKSPSKKEVKVEEHIEISDDETLVSQFVEMSPKSPVLRKRTPVRQPKSPEILSQNTGKK